MKNFIHHNARTLREASRLLMEYKGKAKINAGGTDLLGAMRDKSLPVYPEAVINIKTVESLDYIKRSSRGIRIGALARLADIAVSNEVKEEYALLSEAVKSVATPHIRNMATIGGNLAQEVRCWYYRYPRQIGGPIHCLRKGGKICNALLGDNRYHSIFGAASLSLNPCSGHCPAGIAVSSYLDHVKQGDLDGAARIIMEHNPIPAVTGRVCPAFCESGCNRGELDDPVAIRAVERELGDYILRKAESFYKKPDHQTGKSIAVIGSGPAGLSAAYYLRRAGHRVVILERFSTAGGMLTHSIPGYRLPGPVVEEQIRALEDMGIEIRTGVEVGSAITVPQLMDEFDAVFLAAGAWKERSLGIEGEDLAVSGLGFLNRVSAGSGDLPGKRAAVVGGGNVAVDVARMLRRLGAEPVVLYRRTEMEMPAFREEVGKAREEGVEFEFLTLPTRISRSGKGVLIECVDIKLGEPDESGRPKPEQVPGSEHGLSFDVIIQAIGEERERELFPLEIPESEKGFAVLPYHGKDLFLGGDFLNGPSTVSAAVFSGREAALAIEASLGEEVRPRETEGLSGSFVRPWIELDRARTVLPERPVNERMESIEKEDLPGMGEENAKNEARRCFNCGCLAVTPSDIGVALVALDADIVTTKRNVAAQDFFRADAARSNILDPDELIKEIRIPRPPDGARQKWEKFTLRKPVDFAIVSVAAVVTERKGVCIDARIVLGAVAPEPMRMKQAEDALKGRPLSESTARSAAEQAVMGAIPLTMNDYKVDIVKALVKKAVVPEKS